jgi:hypothetical protein
MPIIRATSPSATRIDVEVRLLSFDRIAMTTQVTAERRYKTIFTQKAGTAAPEAAPGKLSALTAGITLSANKKETETNRTAQTSSVRLQNTWSILMIPSVHDS